MQTTALNFIFRILAIATIVAGISSTPALANNVETLSVPGHNQVENSIETVCLLKQPVEPHCYHHRYRGTELFMPDIPRKKFSVTTQSYELNSFDSLYQSETIVSVLDESRYQSSHRPLYMTTQRLRL